MGSLFSFVFFMLFMLLFISLGMVATSQFIEHMQKHHPERFKAMTGNSFGGISAGDLWASPVKPLVFLRFLVSSECYNDEILRKHKARFRMLLLIYLGLSIFAAMLID